MKTLHRLFPVLLASALCACAPGQSPGNPASLWLSYAQSELDLVLVDHEPPPF